jgi:hypothetical protein
LDLFIRILEKMISVLKKNFTAKTPKKYQNDQLLEKNAINFQAVADLYCCLQWEARQEFVQNCFYEGKSLCASNTIPFEHVGLKGAAKSGLVAINGKQRNSCFPSLPYSYHHS